MSKSDMYMSSFHIYVEIVIYVQITIYIYPNCNIYIYIQMVIYMHPKHKCCACPLSVLYITSYTSSHIYEPFDVYMSRSFSTYLFFFGKYSV